MILLLRVSVLSCLLGIGQVCFSQGVAKDSIIFLDFSFRADDVDIILSSPFQTEGNGDSVQVDVLRFYVAHLNLFNPSGTSAQLETKWHLIDAGDEKSLRFEYEVDVATQGLIFQFGVDSLTNDTGIHGGALDPTKGMYWAWQTGYINFKLEGSSANCPAADGGFTYHIGGFLDNLDASREIELLLRRDEQLSLGISNEVSLVIEIDRLLEAAHQTLGCRLMRPSKEAVEFVDMIDNFMHLEQ